MWRTYADGAGFVRLPVFESEQSQEGDYNLDLYDQTGDVQDVLDVEEQSSAEESREETLQTQRL